MNAKPGGNKAKNAFRRARNAIKFANRLRREVVKVRRSEGVNVDITINEKGVAQDAKLNLTTRGQRRKSLPYSFGSSVHPLTDLKNIEVSLPSLIRSLERDVDPGGEHSAERYCAEGPDLPTVIGTKLLAKHKFSPKKKKIKKTASQNNKLKIVRIPKRCRWQRSKVVTVESLFTARLRKHAHFVENCYVVYD
jgi:hypothetical protein